MLGVLLPPHALRGLAVGERVFFCGVWVYGDVVVVGGGVLVAFFSLVTVAWICRVCCFVVVRFFVCLCLLWKDSQERCVGQALVVEELGAGKWWWW